MPEFDAKRQQNKQAGWCPATADRLPATIANLRHAGKIRVIADEQEQRISPARGDSATWRQQNNYNQ
jgi:hypothetical protein